MIEKGKVCPFIDLKCEITPILPQEPHYFSGGSSQFDRITLIKYMIKW